MVCCILWEADGNVGCIGELHQMRVLLRQREQSRDDPRKIRGNPIERIHKLLVAEGRFEDFPERFLGGNVLFLLEDRAGGGFDVGEYWFPTFGMFPFLEFQ